MAAPKKSAAMSDPVLREQVLARAYSELQAFRRKYEHLTELAQVFEAMDRLRTEAA